MNFNLSEELINKVLGYLGNRPYVETNELITEIQAVCAEQIDTGPDLPLKKTKNIS